MITGPRTSPAWVGTTVERLAGLPLDVKATRDRFLDAFHELIQGASLRVATVQRRNRRHVEALRVPFDDNVELSAHQCTTSEHCTSDSVSWERPIGAVGPKRPNRLSTSRQHGQNRLLLAAACLNGGAGHFPAITALA